MQITDITTAETVFYGVGIKSSVKGRKVFDAGSGSCGDKAFVLTLAQAVAEANPTMPVFLIDSKAGLKHREDAGIRMAHDALYADIEDEDDVNLDELSDDEL